MRKRRLLQAVSALTVGALFSTFAPVAGPLAWLAGPTMAVAQDAARPAQPAPASQPATPPPAGQQPQAVPGQPPASGAAQPAPGQPPAAQPTLPPEYPPGEAPNIQRPIAPPAPADRAELNVRIDKNGKVRFHFRGQPWPDVLNWLAEISGMSLDWQELPGDYLNLATQRSYTVAEAHDLINRHLLARGFTLLEDDEVLNVVNLKKLDPALVPRVEPHELLKRRPHEFVKVSFELDSLVAESAVEELKPMLSPNGRLTSLKATNRLEAMDAVVNLRALYKVLGDEQSEEGQERLVREFELEHTKASEVQQQVLALLGVEDRTKTNATLIENMKPEQIQRLMQQQLEASSRDEGRRGRGGGPPSILGGKPDVSLVVNPRRNSLLALAPPDKLAVIAQAVKMLDVPRDGVQTIAGSVQRMQAFRLAALDPAAVVKLLEDSGTLEPTTKLQVDEKNKAVVVHGSLADQMAIRAVIEKLDGTGRKFHVFPLRRLEADYVAGTVEFMMGGGGNEDKQQSSRYSPYYDPYRSRRETPEPERDKFRVEGDVENNRLLLWANDIEVEEVTSLLVKLGEIPPRRNGETVNGANATRVFSPGIDVDTDALMDQLRRVWPTLAPNPLELPGAGAKPNVPRPNPQSETSGAATPGQSPAKQTPTTKEPAKQESAKPATRADLPLDSSSPADGDESTRPALLDQPIRNASTTPRSTAQNSSQQAAALSRSNFESASLDGQAARNLDGAADQLALGEPAGAETDADSGAEAIEEAGAAAGGAQAAPSTKAQGAKTQAAPPQSPPVRLARTADGRLLAASNDPAALDLLEELINQLVGERKDFHVFQLKHAQAYWVRLNIEKFFEEEKTDKQSSRARNYYYVYDSGPTQKTETKHRLSKRRSLKFIADSDTNTIVVVGADDGQLKIIADLIKVYDQPEPGDTKTARVTEVYQVKWSKAQTIADAVKDVYRDLLSANDKAIVGPDGRNRPQNQTNYIFGESSDEDKKLQVTFKGKLSIGVDEVANTLLISTDGQTLFDNVRKMVEELDQAARPNASVQVIKLDGGVNPEAVRRAIEGIILERDTSTDSSRSNSGTRNRSSSSSSSSQSSRSGRSRSR